MPHHDTDAHRTMTPTPLPRPPVVWPSEQCTVIVAHSDGTETSSVATVPYEPGRLPPGPVIHTTCVRACAACAAVPRVPAQRSADR